VSRLAASGTSFSPRRCGCAIERGKFADFLLVPGDPVNDIKAIKTISMVVKDGAVYFPDEVYAKIGIKPFAKPVEVTPAK